MDILYDILDKISYRGASPNIFKTIGNGGCMMSTIDINKMLWILQSETDNNGKRVKQILLSAMSYLDGDKILNKSLLYKLWDQMKVNKEKFNRW